MIRLCIALFTVLLVSCASSKKTEPQSQTVTTIIVCDTIQKVITDTLTLHKVITDTLKITDSIFIKETDNAIELLKQQIPYHNLDQLGSRTLQLANMLYQNGHEAEALAFLERFSVYKPAINFWIDSANSMYDKITGAGKAAAKPDSAKLEVINSLTAQIRNMKNANMNPMLIINLADSLRSIAPGDSVLAWLEKQLPSQTESSDAFCEEQRKIAAPLFQSALKNKAKAKALLTEAVEALDKCLARTPSADMRKKVTKNREDIAKEL